MPPSVGEAVPSLCGHPGEEHTLFAAAGSCVLELDLRAGLGPAAVRRCFAANADEVNCVAASAANGGWLAAADDSGEMQVISLAPAAGSTAAAATEGHTGGSAAGGVVVPAAEGGFPRPARPAAYKTLRRGHSNIAAAAAFRPHRPWELLSGGLDSTVVKWDFSRLRPLQTWNLAGEATASGGAPAAPLCLLRLLRLLWLLGAGLACGGAWVLLARLPQWMHLLLQRTCLPASAATPTEEFHSPPHLAPCHPPWLASTAPQFLPHSPQLQASCLTHPWCTAWLCPRQTTEAWPA